MAQAYVYEDDASGWRHFQNGDLPASGVTAGTYGDSTHVGQFTVNAQGIITGASSIATGAGGSGSWSLIYSSVLNAQAASIDTGANAIANTYTHLVVILRTASTSTAVEPVATFMRFNGDSGANYTSSLSGANTSVLVNSGTSGHAGMITDAQTGADTAMFATSFITIPLYAETVSGAKRGWTGTSQALWKLTTGNNFSALVSGQWSSTAAITQITFLPNAGNFIVGSAAYVYGIT